MDDDLTFSASVWAASTPIEIAPTLKAASLPNLDYATPDDFDDFGPPGESNQEEIGDDDFGDFGDFGEAHAGEPLALEEGVSFEQVPLPGPSHWRPLQLDPFPSRSSLEKEINETLAPIWQYEDIVDVTTDEDIREAEGIAQILLTPDSREMYKMLLQTPSSMKPPNWIRSRIRRQHLIALGIPVNLDEVLPRATSKPLPMLEIHTRPMSAPPDHHSSFSNGGPNLNHQRRAGTPKPGAQAARFGPKPELDMTRINKLLQLNAESLTMQPLANLERYLADIRLQTADTSSLLTHLLQARDSLQQDSEMYNGLIAEMVVEAQKLKSGKVSRTASIRRGTGIV